MTNTMDKFNNYLLEYYKEILSELNFLGILKNFTSSMDIKKLYPLLDYPENNKYFKSDFRNLIIEGKNLTEKDYYEFSLYDSIISTILNSSIFENVDKRYYELSDLKEDFDNGSLDYSFITKFMMKHKFSISEINIVLSNYKPNKRKPVENNFDASLSKVELPKRDNKVKDNFLHNEKYISIIAFLKSNELLYKDYLNNEAVVSILSLAKPYLDFDNAMYPEVNFITLLTVLQTLERKLDIMINSNISSDEEIDKLLDSMYDIYEECKKIIPKENVFEMPNEVINLTDINIPIELLNKLQMGNLDYKKGIEPVKVNIDSNYIIRVNTLGEQVLTFIEYNNNIYILAFGNKNNIIDLTFNFINKNKKLINEVIYGETNERKK